MKIKPFAKVIAAAILFLIFIPLSLLTAEKLSFKPLSDLPVNVLNKKIENRISKDKMSNMR